MDAQQNKQKAFEDLYASARFLKRCNVQAYADPPRGLVVSLKGGSVKEWTEFWQRMEAVGAILGKPAKPPRERL